MTKSLTRQEGKILLDTARQAIQNHLEGKQSPAIELEGLSRELKKDGACFITLTIDGVLRGCVGSIEATQPLIKDVRDRAIGAAFQDPRFPALNLDEYPNLKIEVSRLTSPEKLDYSTPEDLVTKLRPGIDGVILHHQFRRATFLPQVWDQLPEPEQFLERLCQKMGLDGLAWKKHHLEVEIYQAEKFIEND
jgi:AmmeMemoRadiSam system protein A